VRSLLLLLIILAGIFAGAYAFQRWRRISVRRRRRAAYHARREEEDRIWFEIMGEGPGGVNAPQRQGDAPNESGVRSR